MAEILGNLTIFDNPKPSGLIAELCRLGSNANSIILDFFSGSATTAHAIMKLNAEDNGNRKFIMIQLPEVTDTNSEAYKSGFKNISEIGKERIRRVGDKILSELEENQQITHDSKQNVGSNIDLGFKVFNLDSSNLSKWDPEYDNIEQTLLDSVENLVPGRSELD
jgi:adenine-specific DNA-methyltransferase